MKQVYILMSLVTTLFSLSVISCTGEQTTSSSLNAKDLVGRWECVGGSINGEEALFVKTENTSGAIIEFTEEVLTFALLAEAELSKSKQQPYILEEKKIICTNDKNLVFEIRSIATEEGKMTIAFSAQDYDFVMELKRS